MRIEPAYSLRVRNCARRECPWTVGAKVSVPGIGNQRKQRPAGPTVALERGVAPEGSALGVQASSEAYSDVICRYFRPVPQPGGPPRPRPDPRP